MPARLPPDPSKPARSVQPDLSLSLLFIAAGAIAASVGVAKTLVASEGGAPFYVAERWLVIGAGVALVGGLWTLVVLRRLPADCDDRDQYGRHIVGLTFLLLTIGVCN